MNWRNFEQYIAQLYRELGAVDTKHNINICGNQIDVFAPVPSYDSGVVRTIVSCKATKRPVGVKDVREWNTVFQALFDAREADAAVIVSASGFTQDAHALAAKCPVKAIPVDTLRAACSDFRPYLVAQTKEFSEAPVFTRQCYVPLHIKFQKANERVLAEVAIEDFITRPKRQMLILLGDYGAGKTTICKKIFMNIATSRHSMNCAPVYINLRDYPRHLNMQSLLTDLLINRYNVRCSGFSAIRRLIEEGRMVLLLDAFDEMASRTDYQTTIQNFEAIRDLLIGDAKILLTCRTHYFKDQTEMDDITRGTELYRLSKSAVCQFAFLQGLSPADIKQYVKSVCGKKWPEYMARIRHTYNLMALAQRPILLDMITQVLPELVQKEMSINSTTLYALYVGFWLRRDDWRTSLSYDDRLRFTEALAMEMYNNGLSSFTWEDVERTIDARWPHIGTKEREFYKYDIRTCTFIRWQPENGQYEFVHQSFSEHFVARQLYTSILKGERHALQYRRHTENVLHFLSYHPATEDAVRTLRRGLAGATTDNTVANSLSLFCKWSPRLHDIAITGKEIKDGRVSGLAFEKCKLLKCNFSNFTFQNSTFTTSELREVKFTTVRWNGCGMKDVLMQGARWVKTKWEKGTVKSSRWVQSSFEDCTFSFQCEKVEFKECTFRNCDFEGVGGGGITFSNCKLFYSSWSVASLEGARFDAVFVDEREFSAIRDMHTLHKKIWRRPPRFSDVEGLNNVTESKLRKCGVTFV